MINSVSSWREMFDELKKRKGLAIDRYFGSAKILEKVKSIELANAQIAQEAHKMALAVGDLERLSMLDAVTELYNHEVLVKKLSAALRRAERYKHLVLVCSLAIDGFETIVQEYGDLTTDTILRIVANVIASGISVTDILGRYDGHQFLIVMPKRNPAEVALVADHIRERIANQSIIYNWQRFSVTASIGIACFPEHAQEHDQLIACAMAAMENAANRGGDRVLSI